MGELSRVPNWLVAKKTFPGGIRHPKRQKWWESPNQEKPHFGSFHTIFTPGTVRTAGDPISSGDFRYWCGSTSPMAKAYAACRCCGEVVVDRAERKTHRKEGCGSRLEKAFKILAKTKDCAICSLSTKRRAYGIPLCSKDCEHEWEYVTTKPRSLAYVLESIVKEAKVRV